MKKLFILWMFLCVAILRMHAQTGAISGTVTDEKREAIIGAVVQVLQNGSIKGSAQTDVDGAYAIKSLNPGSYDVKVTYTSYKTEIVKHVIVRPDGMTNVDVQMKLDTKKLQEVAVTAYKVPMVDKYIPGGGRTIQREEIDRMPTRNTSTIAPTAQGVYKKGKGAVSISGCRANATQYIVDGIAVAQQMPPFMPQAHPADESYKKEAENDFRDVTASPLSTMSIDVDRASYSNIRRFINDGQMPPADAVRVEEMINYFDYKYPQPEGDEPLNIVTTLTDCPWQPQHKLLHIGMQARTISTDDLPPSNLVFLVDVSGSMSEENKLPLAIKALQMLTKKLRPEDKISIVVYAGNAGLVLPATSGADKGAINAALGRLQAGGSTAGGAGIKLAYSIAGENYVHNGNNRVILATDGDFNVGVSGDNEMESLITEERKKGIYLTCLGFGMGNYKDSKMEVLADKGNGNYAYIDNEKEAEKTLVKEFGGTIFTLAKDVKTQIEFNPQFVKSYRLVGYENRLLNTEDFKDDKKDAGDMGSGHSVTIIYELIPTGVESKNEPNVEPLKYQLRNNTGSNELATIRFRYKKPNGNTSKEISHIVANKTCMMQNAGNDVQFATSVAMFGMLLKHSAYKGVSSYSKALSIARNSMGEDKNEYRSEFIELVSKVKKSHNNSEQDKVAGWYDEE